MQTALLPGTRGLPDDGRPSVLVVSFASLGALSGSGITLANLFRGWSADRIAQVYGEPLAPDAVLCSRAWRRPLVT